LADLKLQMATHEKTLQVMDKDPGKGFFAAEDHISGKGGIEKSYDKNWELAGVNPREIFQAITKKETFQSPEAFEKAFLKWKEAMSERVVPGRGKSGKFSYGSLNSGHGIDSEVSRDGTLEFTIRSTDKKRQSERGSQIGKSKESGADLFTRMMLYHGDSVSRIEAYWTSHNELLKDNFDSFRSKTLELGDPQLAVWETFTGKMAKTFGYTKAEITGDIGSEVTVVFERE
jgi:hypothetical protein